MRHRRSHVPTEIERKFLVTGTGWRQADGVRFSQGYLCRGEGSTVRVREAGERAFLTIKGPTRGASRAEFEYEIPIADAEQLLKLCDGPVIQKVRHVVVFSGSKWEVDEFLGENTGLIVAEIELEKEAGDATGAATKKAERDQFVFDDLQERVKRYPNDLRLRYELGSVLYENEYLNEAIQQFQLSQRSPKYRLRSLYFLGMSFKKKQQLDMALEQLSAADSELTIMDDTRKELCYEIGLIHEELGDKAKAVECFKKIYQADIGYRDVAQRVEKAYRR